MAIGIRKLTEEERVQAFPGRGQQDLSEYADALRELTVGDAAAVSVEDLSQRALKRRLTQAAKQLGYRIKWSSYSSQDELYLQILQVPVNGSSWPKQRQRRSKGAKSQASEQVAS